MAMPEQPNLLTKMTTSTPILCGGYFTPMEENAIECCKGEMAFEKQTT